MNTKTKIAPARPLPDYHAVHPLTQGLSEKLLRSALADACARTDFAAWEPIPTAFLERHGLASLADACCHLHFRGEKDNRDERRCRCA